MILMLERLDPSLVKMQFQVAAITSGYKAQDYFRKFPGRFISAHLQDYDPSNHKKEVVMGTGIVDWKDFFKAAKVGGLNIFLWRWNLIQPSCRDARIISKIVCRRILV